MANRKVTMTHLRAIIREFKLGTPMREIERKLKISRTSLRPFRYLYGVCVGGGSYRCQNRYGGFAEGLCGDGL